MTEQRKQKERRAFFDFFKKEQKKQTEPEPIKINVMDYTHSAWGNACFFNNERKSADGFCPYYRTRPEEGTIVFKADAEKKKVFVARLHNVRWSSNPSDAFFSKYEVIKSTKELQEEELKQLREQCDRFYGITIEEDEE